MYISYHQSYCHLTTTPDAHQREDMYSILSDVYFLAEKKKSDVWGDGWGGANHPPGSYYQDAHSQSDPRYKCFPEMSHLQVHGTDGEFFMALDCRRLV